MQTESVPAARLFLGLVTLPVLVDQIGMDGIDIRLVQYVGEAFHAQRRERALQYDVAEGGVHFGWQFPEIWCHAWPQSVAT